MTALVPSVAVARRRISRAASDATSLVAGRAPSWEPGRNAATLAPPLDPLRGFASTVVGRLWDRGSSEAGPTEAAVPMPSCPGEEAELPTHCDGSGDSDCRGRCRCCCRSCDCQADSGTLRIRVPTVGCTCTFAGGVGESASTPVWRLKSAAERLRATLAFCFWRCDSAAEMVASTDCSARQSGHLLLRQSQRPMQLRWKEWPHCSAHDSLSAPAAATQSSVWQMTHSVAFRGFAAGKARGVGWLGENQFEN